MDNQPNEAPSVKQQLVEILRGAESVVVTTKENPSKDEIAAAIGLHLLLEKVEKVAEVVITSDLPKQLEFLPSDFINKQLQGQRDFVIELDQSRTEADHLKYVTETGKLKIYITPYNGSFSENDVAFSYGDYHCDAIVGLGVQDVNSLNSSVIQEQKLIKDAKFLLVNAGQGSPGEGNVMNWSDPNASSICEMIMSMSEALGSGMLDEEISTALLTGIVDKTQHFTNQATTPKVMTMSAQLLAAGAHQAEIVKQLSQPDKPQEPAKKPEEKPAGPAEGDKKQEDSDKEEAAKKRAPNELQIRQPKQKQSESDSGGKADDKQSSQELPVRDQTDGSASDSEQNKQTQDSGSKPPESPASGASDSGQAATGAKAENTGSSGQQTQSSPAPQPSPVPAPANQNPPQQQPKPPQGSAAQQPQQNSAQKPPEPQGSSSAPKPSDTINPAGAASQSAQGAQPSSQNTSQQQPPKQAQPGSQQPASNAGQKQPQPQGQAQQQTQQAQPQQPQPNTSPPAAASGGQQSPPKPAGNQAVASGSKTGSNDNEKVVQPPSSSEGQNSNSPLSHDELLASLEDNGIKAKPPASGQSAQPQQQAAQQPSGQQPQQAAPQQNPQQNSQSGAGGRVNLDEARKAVEEAQEAQKQDDSSGKNQ